MPRDLAKRATMRAMAANDNLKTVAKSLTNSDSTKEAESVSFGQESGGSPKGNKKFARAQTFAPKPQNFAKSQTSHFL